MAQRFVTSGWVVLLFSLFVLQGCGGGGGLSTPPPVPAITDINGGAAGSGTVGSLFIIDGSGFGVIQAAMAGYSVDFRDSAAGTVVASATIDYTPGDWQNIYIKGTVPNGLTAGTTYKVTVTTPGGTSNSVSFLVAASVSYSPSTIGWSMIPNLPQAQTGFATAVVPVTTTTGTVTTTNTYLYTLGGNFSSSTTSSLGMNTDAVDYNLLSDATGTLVNAAWTATTVLPEKRGFVAAVAANSFNSMLTGSGAIYVLGGLDASGSAVSTVYSAMVNTDGTVPASGAAGSWTAATPLPQALFAASAVVFHGRIYVAGGNDSTGAPVKKVYSARINADGTLAAWDTLADLPDARAYHQLLAAAGYLYVVGGDNAAVDPLTNASSSSAQGTVLYNQINLLDGSLVNATWTSTSGLGKNREKLTAVVAGSNVVVTGGLYNGQPGSSESVYASLNSDGTLGSFGGATGTNTISSLSSFNPYNQATAYFVDAGGKPHVYILGGQDAASGDPNAGCWYQH